ncbi:ParB/RepB/Spo0J family partition protein [Deinococcus ruber]|uniref:Chromosome partitioning protein ParB n=1 Tax=Deinococcus ruber TaxID=1848197 RepID=A0A918FH33_9DEIO|nr:ParB/RepB/Spo0J family partition protein [Deinococcus ruber]GGR37195.1 chromosome partitioning protein ParB [Deinococcus ruber]
MTRSSRPRAAINPMDMMEALSAKSADTELAVSQIVVVEAFNPRRLLSGDEFTQEALTDLADSIRTHGVLQPLLVRRQDHQILLIAGERRLRAAILAGLERVPVVYVEADDQVAYELAIIENSQRKDLDIVTESLVGFEFMAQRFGMSTAEVVTYLNAVRKGRRPDDLQAEALLRQVYGTGVTAWSVRRAAILKMLPEEHDAIRRGDIDAKTCAELVTLPAGPDRSALLARAVSEQLSAERVRALVRDQQGADEPTASTLAQRVQSVRNVLPQLSRLKGKDALKAERLIAEIETKVTALLQKK